MDNSVGYAWLREKYGLGSYALTHQSFIGTRLKQEVDDNGDIIETYTPLYTPTDPADPLQHLEFGLKYDDCSLEFLKAVFEAIPIETVVAYLTRKPRGSYERRIGYLYELLTSLTLPVVDQGKGNYIDLLDANRYVVGKGRNIPRWNIRDNLLGTVHFCPMIRRTKALEKLLEIDYRQLVAAISQAFPPDIFHRALTYLYRPLSVFTWRLPSRRP